MEVIENESVKFWLQNEIIYCIYKSEEITLSIARKNVGLRLEFCKGKTYPMFGDMSFVKSATREARKYLSQGESQRFLSAGAFLVRTPIEKHLINFWIKIDKPVLPCRFFTEEREAIEWLQKYKS